MSVDAAKVTAQDVAWLRRWAERDSNSRWELADRSLKIAPLGANGVKDGSQAVLQEWFDQAGVEGVDVDTLRRWRTGAAAFPPEKRPKGMSIHAAVLIAGESRRHQIVESLAKKHPQGRVTVDAVREWMGKRPTRFAPPPANPTPATEAVRAATPEEKVEIARQVMSDPDVQRQMASPKADDARREVFRAALQQGELASKRRVAARDQAVPRDPEWEQTKVSLGQAGALIELQTELSRARLKLNRALAGARATGIIERGREDLLAMAEDLQITLDWIKSYLASGDTSWDEALAKLTGEEA